MNTPRTEEEQIEALKRWWHDYGTLIVITLLVVIAAIYGWRYWSTLKEHKAQAASIHYQNLLTGLDNNQPEQVMQSANHLLTDYPSTPYASLASLIVSADFVEKNDIEQAKTYLQWTMDHTKDVNLNLITHLRMIRVLIAHNEIESAQTLLKSTPENKAFSSAFTELKGDIYYHEKEFTKAYEAYKQALNTLPPNLPEAKLLEMKMQDVAP